MPWKETVPMTERIKLITEHLSGDYGVTDLSRRHGVSRRVVYKWIERFEKEGWEGLKERSRAPHHQAGALEEEIEKMILELKQRWPDWGAPKLRWKLEQMLGSEACPAESTVGAVLKRHGLVKARRVRNKAVSGTSPLAHCQEANRVWCADFKGWWRTKNGERCEPLTVSDAWSRYLLRCAVVPGGTSGMMVKPHFELLFREYGLPEAIRSDNGAPFASTALGGLTKLSAWWVRLGIRLERIQPGCPQENGRHERIHLSLEKSAARAPRANLRAQQEALEKFRREYNEERPHEALGLQTPAELYRPSLRVYHGGLPKAREYPDDWEIRRVRGAGQMKWRSKDVAISWVLAGESVGLEPRADGIWAVWYEHMELGLFDERKGKIQRHRKLTSARQEPAPR
jgi:putative transposase